MVPTLISTNGPIVTRRVLDSINRNSGPIFLSVGYQIVGRRNGEVCVATIRMPRMTMIDNKTISAPLTHSQYPDDYLARWRLIRDRPR